jgi:hypothetical protein
MSKLLDIVRFDAAKLGVFGGGAARSGLTTKLIAFYPGNEVSGNLIDAHTGHLDMAASVSAPGSASSGLVYSTSRTYDPGNSQRFGRNSETLLQNTGDLTITAWVKLNVDVTANARSIISKDSSGSREYYINLQGPLNKLYFGMFNTLGTEFTVSINSISKDAPHLVIATFNSSTRYMTVAVDNGIADTKMLTGTPKTGNAILYVGSRQYFDDQFFSGAIGPIAMWRKVLSPDQQTWLFDSGAGRAYAELINCPF